MCVCVCGGGGSAAFSHSICSSHHYAYFKTSNCTYKDFSFDFLKHSLKLALCLCVCEASYFVDASIFLLVPFRKDHA